jgi:sec-independent protein translocase protein TatA
MQPSIWQLLIVAALVLILFGRGRISEMMGDVGKGIRSFKKGIAESEAEASTAKNETDNAGPPKQIEDKSGIMTEKQVSSDRAS